MNAVYSTRLYGAMSLDLIDIHSMLCSLDVRVAVEDISYISHCHTYSETRVIDTYVEVVFETGIPPMSIDHILIEADDEKWLEDHFDEHSGYINANQTSHVWYVDKDNGRRFQAVLPRPRDVRH